MRIKSMRTAYSHRAVNAMSFGQPLVIDCGYEEHMVNRERTSYVNQMICCYTDNMQSVEPFKLHYCMYFVKSTLAALWGGEGCLSNPCQIVVVRFQLFRFSDFWFTITIVPWTIEFGIYNILTIFSIDNQ